MNRRDFLKGVGSLIGSLPVLKEILLEKEPEPIWKEPEPTWVDFDTLTGYLSDAFGHDDYMSSSCVQWHADNEGEFYLSDGDRKTRDAVEIT